MGDRTNPGFRLDGAGASSEDGRLAALERGHLEMSVQMGKQELALTYLSNEIKRGFEDLTAIVKPLSEKVVKLDDMLDSHQSFIVDLKEVQKETKKNEEQAKKDKRGFWMKFVVAGGSAVTAAAGTMIFEKYLAHFFR